MDGGGGGSSSQSNGGDVVSTGGGTLTGPPQQLIDLGEKIFKDKNLSSNGTQSCESCHDPASGFADPDNTRPVSEGAILLRLGTRNSPTISYAREIDPFSSIPSPNGGLFLDGREPRLEEQAQRPFLNKIEMNMIDEAAVVTALMAASYAEDFKAEFGDNVFNNVNNAYLKMSEAIAAFERSDAVSPFTSKFDNVKKNLDVFTINEANGEAVFRREKCNRCHIDGGVNPLFTNFGYENIGVPENPFVLMSSMDSTATPVVPGFQDFGLGAITAIGADDGKFRTPTLRNVAITGPYMHNGVFSSLAQVIDFYNNPTRPTPEVTANVTTEDVGALGMSDPEMTDLIAFLNTLTDL